MTNDLYRQEALDHKARGLYGEVILSAPPASWVLTLIIIAFAAIIMGLLFFGQIQTDSGPVSLWSWLMQRAA